MLSANSSSALAPVVSMDVIRVGSLFLVLAAVPYTQQEMTSLRAIEHQEVTLKYAEV